MFIKKTDSNDDEILFARDYSQTPLLRRKIYLTVPICALLFVIFITSALLVTMASLYWNEDIICNKDQIDLIPFEPRPVYISRPKRSTLPKLSKQPTKLPCLAIQCCETFLDPNVGNVDRLPTNVSPIEYQLTLNLYQLNETVDTYSGMMDIVIEVRSPTNDIVLHDVSLIFSDITVTQRSNPSDIPLTIDCAVPFPDSETLVIHLSQELQVGNVYDVHIGFFQRLSVHGTGLFENQFPTDPFSFETSRMLVTHFEPVHARETFPCFDEPGFKTKFQLTIRHANSTQALANYDEISSFWDGDYMVTEFNTVPPISTALVAFSVFSIGDFVHQSVFSTHPLTNRDVTIRLWARKRYLDDENGIYITATLDMIRRIFDALQLIFQEVETVIVPNKLDILAVPDYPSEATSNWGLIIFSEQAILHNPETTSELDHQRIALLIGKQLAEQWYGNLVSFQWWTDLWLQEGIGNYLKYHAVDIAYPTWAVYDQFVTLEMFPIMFDDSMSTSHPVVKSVNSPNEIDELFDSIETSKVTAILRMADYYLEKTMGIKNGTLFNLVEFLHDREYGFLIPDDLFVKYRFGSWSGPDFFDRWFLQSNFPSIYARLTQNTDGSLIFQLDQSRYISTLMPIYDLYPPETNSFGYIWFIPLNCYFGTNPTTFTMNRTFLFDRESMNYTLDSNSYTYFHCNTDFAGYYLMDYSKDDWEQLSNALDNDNQQLNELDRANILHNAFMDALASEESYSIVTEVTQFLQRSNYSGLLPWQALSIHVNRMLDVLEYESIFASVEKYFRLVVRNYYQTNALTLWNENGTFQENVLKNTIIQLACRLQLQQCVDTVTTLWNDAYPALLSGTAVHSVADHARSTVYQTHFRNTYNDSEWWTIESEFHTIIDIQERHRLLEALTQSRQPWHLYQFLYQDAQENQDRDVDLLEVLTLFAYNPAGRELAWLFYRENWADLENIYGRSTKRLGQLLIDITATFEDEFHELELLNFLASTPGVNTNVDARFWALERANMNFFWITDKSRDMEESFSLDIKRV